MRKALPAAESARTWTPSLGHVYQQPPTAANKIKVAESKEDTPMPDAQGKASETSQKSKQGDSLARLAEESFAIHLKYGGDYIDENPITGRPGDFHLSTTGRKEKLAAPKAGAFGIGTPKLNTNVPGDGKVDAKADKSPKTPNTPGKPKRRKSKTGGAAAS